MRRRPSWVLVSALVVVGAACDLPNLVPPGSARLRYRDQVFSTFVKTADVTYGSAVNASNQTVSLELDVFKPPLNDPNTMRPAIVWVHGGGFCLGDKTSAEIVDLATTFVKKGYVSASINYRLAGGCFAENPLASIPSMQHATEDAQAAVRFLRTHAATYGIDRNRIAIGGMSAGAFTALQVGYATSENPASAVSAAVSVSGANVISAINAGDAPALLFHGTNDGIVPYQWAVNTTNSARAAHLDVFLQALQGAGHVGTQFRSQILTQTTNFLWWEMDLQNAAQ